MGSRRAAGGRTLSSLSELHAERKVLVDCEIEVDISSVPLTRERTAAAEIAKIAVTERDFGKAIEPATTRITRKKRK